MEKQICPICGKNPIFLPHGVCRECFQHYKSENVHDACWHLENRKRLGLSMEPAFLQRDIELSIKEELDEWEHLTKKGLSACTLASDVIDNSSEDATNPCWLKREAFFMIDLIRALPQELFSPVTVMQMDAYLQSATNYWNGKLTEQEKTCILKKFAAVLDKQSSVSAWDEKSLPIWLMELSDTESFDWMLGQLMDCIVSCNIKDELSDVHWAELFQKHFPEELARWVHGQ